MIVQIYTFTNTSKETEFKRRFVSSLKYIVRNEYSTLDNSYIFTRSINIRSL